MLELAQKVMVRIEDHRLGFGVELDLDHLLGRVDSRGGALEATDNQPHFQRNGVDRRAIARVLCLLDIDQHFFAGVVPAPAVLQHGMARFEKPLLEKRLAVNPARVREGAAEIFPFHGRVAVLREVLLDAPKERRIAQLAAQGVQDRAALGVGVAVEHGIGVGIHIGRDGALVAARLIKVAAHVAVYLAVVGMLAPAMLHVERLKESGKALVEPRLAPVLARHQIAKPLVGQLMGVEAGHVAKPRAKVRQCSHSQGRGRDILHPAAKVVHRVLGVLGPGVLHARDRGEELQHVGRVAEAGVYFVGVAPRHHIPQRHSAPLILLDIKGASHQREEVGGVGLAHLPLHGSPASLDFVTERQAVAHDTPVGGHGGDGLGSGHVVGVVPRHGPLPVARCLTLGPEPLFLWGLLARVHPVKAIPLPEAPALDRATAVGKAHQNWLGFCQRRGEAHVNQLPLALESQAHARRVSRLDLKIFSSMEAQHAQTIP